jgi:uncharacterized protein (TIGR00299 family) protein
MTNYSKRILVFDPQMAGISGDMIIGALLDLGAAPARVIEAMKTPKHHLKGCRELEITVAEVPKNGIQATKINVKIDEDIIDITAVELLNATTACLQDVRISHAAKDYVLTSINKLVSAEATIHGQSFHNIHLHELGSADTIADIIGAATALDDLDIFSDAAVFSTPVAIGGGVFPASHGAFSSPAPVTIEILRSSGFLTIGGPVDAELATPTGVSLLTSLTSECTRFYPPIKPTDVGYGAGSKDFDDIPNVLRVILGEPFDSGLMKDEVVVIETNLDDVTGEVIGYSINKLLQEGARDVVSIPTLNKKGRPGHLIQVIADRSNVERLCTVLIEETGSLGVRTYACNRRLLLRESIPVEVMVDNKSAIVNVKVAKDTNCQIIRIKPEYDDVKRLSELTGKPLRDIEDLVVREAREVL